MWHQQRMDRNKKDTESLALKHIAVILNVSPATVRNWIKTGIIIPPATVEQINKIKSDIETGKLQRLNLRANKGKSLRKYIPDEYSGDRNVLSLLSSFLETLTGRIDINSAIFCSTLILLEEAAEFTSKESDFIHSNNFKRKSVYLVMAEWFKTCRYDKDILDDIRILAVNKGLHTIRDFCGMLYQAMRSEGNKSVFGSYYTPSQIVRSSLKILKGRDSVFLDPCCGTGSFLIEFVKSGKIKPENIYGIDIDPIAVNIARLNILLACPDFNQIPKVFCKDSIFDNDLFWKNKNIKIDCIATNPPWGAAKNKKLPDYYKKILKSNEIFSAFIVKSYDLLHDDGEMFFVLPSSILNIKIHAGVRKFLTKKTKIIEISEAGRVFTGVFSSVIQLRVKKLHAQVGSTLKVIKKDSCENILQTRFDNNYNCIFDINTSNLDENLISKIYSINHKTLKNNARWSLGVVTGNNNLHLVEKEDLNCVPVLKGSNINRFTYNDPRYFLKINESIYQQYPKSKLHFENEKLIYRFIADKPVFAYDNQKILTLNSANIMIPAIPGMSMRFIMAYLNSEVFEYLFKLKFAAIKVLRGDMEQLPFPILDKKTATFIDEHVGKILKGQNEIKELNEIIFNSFGLSNDEKIYLRNRLKK